MASATKRKENIESVFKAYQQQGILNRFEAITSDDVQKKNILGNISNSEKACFLSHASLIFEHDQETQPFMVMEDDVVFCQSTFQTIEKMLVAMQEVAWDILYTDVCIPMPTTMIDLIQLKKSMLDNDSFRLLDLKNIHFAGATSYIVNNNSVEKLSQLLNSERELNVPYDLFLRNKIHTNELNGFAIFPFVTSLSDDSFNSQIQPGSSINADFVWNTYRKLIWTGSRLDDTEKYVKKIQDELTDPMSNAFSSIISACLSHKFTFK